MVCTDGDSRDIGRPEGIAQGFQVNADATKPAAGSGNLLAKDRSRPSCSDEPPPLRPPIRLNVTPSGCAGVRLAGARACPNRSVVGPACRSQGVAPDPDAGEEVALDVAAEVVGADFNDAALIYIPWRDVAGRNEIAQPLGGVGVDLVVVGATAHFVSALSNRGP